MKIDLANKHALVGGSSKGLGLAIAQQMAAAGATITLMARDTETLTQRLRELPTPAGQKHTFLTVDFNNFK
ncbi:MAG: SDR family NAD(P)-dependent oxidoreductase, partial [Flavobacteriaceae bacterium]